jgi:hypothetical protein
MSVISGFDLLAHMKKNEGKRHPLVVMCSTSASDIDRRMAASFPVAGHLKKPRDFLCSRIFLTKVRVFSCATRIVILSYAEPCEQTTKLVSKGKDRGANVISIYRKHPGTIWVTRVDPGMWSISA